MTSSVVSIINRWSPKVNSGKSVVIKHWKVITVHIALWILLLIVFICSFLGTYWLFYNWYIPAERIIQPIYFNYTATDPLALANIDLQRGLEYDISLKLLVPDIAGLSESLGPVVFTSKFNGDAIISVRPMLVIYRSWPVRMSLLVLRMVPVVIGLAHEATSHRVFLLEKYKPLEGSLTSLKVEMSGRLPTYEILLEAVAHFSGLRYIMYYWKWTFAGLIIGSLSLISVLTLTIVLGISLYGYINEKRLEVSSELSIKSPSEISSKLRETPAAVRPGWDLVGLRRRLSTTDELRVPNGHALEESEDESDQ